MDRLERWEAKYGIRYGESSHGPSLGLTDADREALGCDWGEDSDDGVGLMPASPASPSWKAPTAAHSRVPSLVPKLAVPRRGPASPQGSMQPPPAAAAASAAPSQAAQPKAAHAPPVIPPLGLGAAGSLANAAAAAAGATGNGNACLDLPPLVVETSDSFVTGGGGAPSVTSAAMRSSRVSRRTLLQVWPELDLQHGSDSAQHPPQLPNASGFILQHLPTLSSAYCVSASSFSTHQHFANR